MKCIRIKVSKLIPFVFFITWSLLYLQSLIIWATYVNRIGHEGSFFRIDVITHYLTSPFLYVENGTVKVIFFALTSVLVFAILLTYIIDKIIHSDLEIKIGNCNEK